MDTGGFRRDRIRRSLGALSCHLRWRTFTEVDIDGNFWLREHDADHTARVDAAEADVARDSVTN